MNITLDDIRDHIEHSVRTALQEDIQDGDITAQLIPADKTDIAVIITREECVMCGQAWLEETFRQLGGITSIEWHVKDGDWVNANDKLVTLTGNTRVLLTGERTALNFIQLLSAVATKAKHYTDLVQGSHTKLLDTRKTIPGLRLAQKYAVTVGGCHNHRIGLYDAYLIKENHIAGCGSIAQAVATAKAHHPDKKVEVEVENLEELQQAINAGADIAMLDNFDDDMLQAALKLDKNNTQFEFSGNLTDADIRRLSSYNIDYMSFGALTKHVRAVDLSMRLV